MDIQDIKLREIELFLTLVKTQSVRELARQQGMQPGQVSKWIQALERKVGVPLLERSPSGITPTARALELIPWFEKISSLQGRLQGEARSSKLKTYSFASSSFFSTHLVPHLMRELSSQETGTYNKLRIIDLAPTNFIPAALRGAFEFCIHSQPLDWPRTWSTKEVGHLEWHIYARKGHPLKKANLDRLIKYPFIVPIYWTPEGTRYGNDECPIPLSSRIKGHETATAASAAEILKVTDQLAFLPELVAKKAEERGELQKIKVPWKPVLKPVYLSVKNSVVKQHDFDFIAHACQKVLSSW